MGLVYKEEDNIVTLALSGSLDKRNAPQVRQAIFNAINGQPAQVIVNLQKVDSLDSSGLSALVAGLRQAQKNHVPLSLCDLQSPVRMIFELTRFDNVFDIFVSEEDAIETVKEQTDFLTNPLIQE